MSAAPGGASVYPSPPRNEATGGVAVIVPPYWKPGASR